MHQYKGYTKMPCRKFQKSLRKCLFAKSFVDLGHDKILKIKMNQKAIILWIIFTISGKIGFSQVTAYQFDPAKVDKVLSATMDSLYKEDQRYRLEMVKLEKENAGKERLDSIRKIIREKDSSNLIFATALIDKYGWPGPEEAGFMGTQALFLIIQHADLKTQKKYYPMILKAEKEGKMLSSNVAILEDRIAVREGREQVYGSQMYYDGIRKKGYVYPLADVKNIDSLRASRGLKTMKEYKADWDEKEYETDLPYAKELLERLKEKNKK
jgi:hypothetical protein